MENFLVCDLLKCLTMQSLKFLLFGFLFSLSFTAQAQQACVSITEDTQLQLSPVTTPRAFDPYTSYENILRRDSEPALNLDAYLALIQHPIFRLPRLLRSQGIELQFDIQRGIADSYLSNNSHLRGENIQGRFVKEILKALFPQAPIAQQISTNPQRKTIYIWIEDPAEYPTPSIVDEEAWLDLNILKAGNPGLIPANHDDLRAKLGVPYHRPVVSVYLRTGSLLDDPIVQRSLIDLATSKGFKDLFISAGSPINPQRLLQVAQQVSANEKIFSLSDVTESSVQESRRWIYNNTSGLLPQIHAAADLSVVVGVVNFFEPLSVKTPTVLFLPASSLHHYNLGALLPLLRIANKTPGFIDVHDTWSWSSAIEQMILTPRQSMVVPALISNPDSPSPFHQVLTALEDLILKQLNINNSQSSQ